VTPPREPLFLARQNYRRRRLADAARLVPVLGALLFMIPILATSGGGASTARGGMYVFLVWLALIGVAGFLSRRLVERSGAASPAPGDDNKGGEPVRDNG